MPEPATGRVLAVWSAAGSAGRSQVAASIACELTALGSRVLLIDADVVSPSQLQLFGFAENHIGIASACRLAAKQELTIDGLNALLLDYEMPKGTLKLLPGLHLVSRWPELGYEPMLELIAHVKTQFDYLVVDISASLERELIDQRTLAERNAVTLAALQAADQVIGLCLADNIGLSRFVWAVQELKLLGHGPKLLTLVNRLPGGAKVSQAIELTLQRLAAIQVVGCLADDPAVFEAAAELSVPVALAPRNSSFKQGLATFVRSQLLGLEVSQRRLAKLG